MDYWGSWEGDIRQYWDLILGAIPLRFWIFSYISRTLLPSPLFTCGEAGRSMDRSCYHPDRHLVNGYVSGCGRWYTGSSKRNGTKFKETSAQTFRNRLIGCAWAGQFAWQTSGGNWNRGTFLLLKPVFNTPVVVVLVVMVAVVLAVEGLAISETAHNCRIFVILACFNARHLQESSFIIPAPFY